MWCVRLKSGLVTASDTICVITLLVLRGRRNRVGEWLTILLGLYFKAAIMEGDIYARCLLRSTSTIRLAVPLVSSWKLDLCPRVSRWVLILLLTGCYALTWFRCPLSVSYIRLMRIVN